MKSLNDYQGFLAYYLHSVNRTSIGNAAASACLHGNGLGVTRDGHRMAAGFATTVSCYWLIKATILSTTSASLFGVILPTTFLIWLLSTVTSLVGWMKES